MSAKFSALFFRFFFCALACAVLIFWAATPHPAQAQAGDGYALLDAINQFRAANGLPPYQINGLLMASAQMHTEYQASQGTWSHTGVGGTDETQRAAALGYGAGARILCDEAVGFGHQYTPQQAIEMWMGPNHLPIMLSSRYLHAGGGAVTDASGRVYYTLNACYIQGQSAGASLPAAPVAQAATSQPNQPIGFQTPTPQPDGSIVHVIQSGETLISIAADYGLSLQELLALNNLNPEGMLRVGDWVIVRGPQTPTPTLSPTSTPTIPVATTTRRPTRTPTAISTLAEALPDTPTPEPTAAPSLVSRDPVGAALLAVVVGLAVAGFILLVAGLLVRRR